MSRSYRKPYATITGTRSAADDKRVARRSVRAAQNQAIKQFNGDWDEFLLPERYECSFNDVWGWGRDGVPTLQKEPQIEDYLKRCDGYYGFNSYCEYTPEEAHEDFNDALERYEDLKRK